jgi:hypothetical protein
MKKNSCPSFLTSVESAPCPSCLALGGAPRQARTDSGSRFAARVRPSRTTLAA